MRSFCGIRVHVSDAALLDDLVESLERAQCEVETVGPETLAVSSPSPLLTEKQARNEISFYLAVWMVRHPGARVQLVG